MQGVSDHLELIIYHHLHWQQHIFRRKLINREVGRSSASLIIEVTILYSQSHQVWNRYYNHSYLPSASLMHARTHIHIQLIVSSDMLAVKDAYLIIIMQYWKYYKWNMHNASHTHAHTHTSTYTGCERGISYNNHAVLEILKLNMHNASHTHTHTHTHTYTQW